MLLMYGKYEEALQYLSKMTHAYEAKLGREHRQTVAAYVVMAGALKEQGRCVCGGGRGQGQEVYGVEVVGRRP